MSSPNPKSGAPATRNSDYLLAAILALATILRLIRLGTFPYWHDEVHNLIAGEDVYAMLVHGNLISNHPPLPYLLVDVWRAVGLDASEWTMRLLPMLAGVATVAAIYTFGKRLFNERVGLIAAFLLAVSPLHVHHSQDVKEYVYLPLVALVMVLWFYRAMETGGMRDWIVYGLLAGLACYTEIFVGPLLVAINLWALPLLRSRKGLARGWFAGNLLGALLFAPWLPIMLQKADNTIVQPDNWWVPAPTPEGVVYYIKAVAFGYTAAPGWFKIAFALYVLLILAGAVAAFRQNRRGAALLLCWAVLPVAIVYGISLVTQSIFLIRAMLPYAIALYVLAAAGLAAIPLRAGRVAALGLVCVVAGVGLLHHYERDYPPSENPHRPGVHPPREDPAAAHLIRTHWKEGDMVVHTSATTWLPFFWYGFRGMPQHFAGVGSQFIADIEMGNPRNSRDPKIEDYWPREPQSLTKDAKRVWLVYSEWERSYLAGNATDVYRWMDAHFNEVERHTFDGLEVRLFLRADDAPALARNNDDGVGADMTYAGRPEPYRKALPDSALVLRPEDARRGGLVVRWTDVTPGDVLRANFAQTDATRSVYFVIENRTDHPIAANAVFLPSDGLVDGPSLYEQNPADEIWHIYGKHNPSPPPDHYASGVASAHLLDQNAGTLTGHVRLTPGTYRTYLYALGTPGDAAHGRANVTVYLGETPAYETRWVDGAPWRWNWLPGEAVDVPVDESDLRVAADGYVDRPVYADVEAVAFARDRGGALRDWALDWPGEFTVPAGGSCAFAAEVDADTPRTDVWVSEYGENGKSYRIYQRSVAEDR